MKYIRHFFCCFLFFICIALQAQPPVANAGTFQKICPNISVTLGGNPAGSGGMAPLSYAWQPTTNLSNPNIAHPSAYPTVTTTYTLTVTGSNGEASKDTVTIFVYNASINAGPDVTIQQGQTITLHAQGSGYTTIWWATTDHNIYNQNTANPDVYPPRTTTYTLQATFPNGCTALDEITVYVIPSKNLFFFNTMTPNGDGANDVFYIGNIDQYPDNVLEIYNRYGQKIYTKTGYQNDWDGKYLNEELPAGTYFYVIDTKSDTGGKHKGSITIIR